MPLIQRFAWRPRVLDSVSIGDPFHRPWLHAVAPNLPPEASVALDAFRDALLNADKANIVCIAIYGSAARGRYDAETSDLNVALALRDASGAAILRIAEALHDAERESRIETMIFAESELAGLAVSFPTKILDIQRRHVCCSARSCFRGSPSLATTFAGAPNRSSGILRFACAGGSSCARRRSRARPRRRRRRGDARGQSSGVLYFAVKLPTSFNRRSPSSSAPAHSSGSTRLSLARSNAFTRTTGIRCRRSSSAGMIDVVRRGGSRRVVAVTREHFDLRGPEFLALYVGLLGVGIVVALFVRRQLRGPASNVDVFRRSASATRGRTASRRRTARAENRVGGARRREPSRVEASTRKMRASGRPAGIARAEERLHS